MDLLQHYAQLVSYDEWANLAVIASFGRSEAPPERSQKWIAHIMAAEHVWLARLLHQKPPYLVWPELTLQESEREAKDLAKAWREFLKGMTSDGLEQTVAYKNSKGEPWSSTVRDILTHVFMHSTYHRGQIAADMRESGHDPAYTDFIHGVRQGLVE
jgi:uncharacterized damage-inducible protein DinB